MSPGSGSTTDTGRLILVPAIITLAITLLRLIGELQHWPTALFNPAAGGGGAIVGITWLAPIFGIYFALKLAGAGEGPTAGPAKVILFAVLGIVLLGVGGAVAVAPQVTFPGREIVGLLLVIASGVIQFRPWNRLGKVLLAYAFAARIPVLILMFFAIRGNWGTHYDVPPPGFPELTFWPKFLQIAFVPQMFLWIAFTMITGALAGGIAIAVTKRGAVQTA